MSASPVLEKAGLDSADVRVDGHHVDSLAVHESKAGSECHGSFKTDDDASDEQGPAAEHHIFSDPVVAEHWRDIYEKANYENRHRFDPTFTWSPEEERALVRKMDLKIMVWAWTMFCALDIHRRNINRAISDNMLAELGS